MLDKGKSDVPLDKIAIRKAKEYFKAKETFTEWHTHLMRIQHIHEGQLWSEVLTAVKEAKPLAVTAEEKAVRHYYRASALTGLKKYEKALKYYNLALAAESSVKSENYSYIIPYAWAELGETELVAGNLARAKELLKKAKKYEDYDWANLLSVRISSSMDKLHRREYLAKHGQPLIGGVPPSPRPTGAAVPPSPRTGVDEPNAATASSSAPAPPTSQS